MKNSDWQRVSPVAGFYFLLKNISIYKIFGRCYRNDYALRLGIADLVRHGLMHNTLVYFIAIVAPLLSQNELLWRSHLNS